MGNSVAVVARTRVASLLRVSCSQGKPLMASYTPSLLARSALIQAGFVASYLMALLTCC